MNKIYLVVPPDLASFGINYPENEAPHYEVFFEKLKRNSKLSIILLFVESFFEIPEDGLIIAYANRSFHKMFHAHPKHKDIEFARRFFIIGMSSGEHEHRIITATSFGGNSFMGVFYPVAYGITLLSEDNYIAKIPVYYWLDILAMEDNIALWEHKIDIIEYYLADTKYIDYKPHKNPIKELCLFLEEYTRKFNYLKGINHFDNSIVMKEQVTKLFSRKTIQKTSIMQKIYNFIFKI